MLEKIESQEEEHDRVWNWHLTAIVAGVACLALVLLVIAGIREHSEYLKNKAEREAELKAQTPDWFPRQEVAIKRIKKAGGDVQLNRRDSGLGIPKGAAIQVSFRIGNYNGEDPFEEIPHLRELFCLELAEADCTERVWKSMAQLEKLERLNLSRCKSKDFFVGVRDCKNLKSLGVADCREIGPERLEPLNELPKLESLILWGIPVTDDDLQILAKLPSLKKLELHRTNVSEEGILSLQAQRPDIVITSPE